MIALVREYFNEPNLPVDATILSFINRGVEQVASRVNGIFRWQPYPTVANQTFIQLNDDVLYIASANFSSGANNTSGFITSSSPLSQGSLVYPMLQLEQGTFMDAAAGFPAVGFGPPQAFFVYSDYGTAPTTTLPVPPSSVFAIQSPGTSNGVSVNAQVTYVNANGETTPSATATQAITTAQQAVVLSPNGVSNASGYNVYVSTSGTFHLQNASPIALGTPYTVAGTPTITGAAPPVANTATGAGTGGAMFMQLYPAAMIGQVNIYYRARPQLLADASATSWTDLDTVAQEAVLLFAGMRVLGNRGRSDEIAPWRLECEGADGDGGLIGRARALLGSQRAIPRSGQIRNITDRSFPSSPWWMRG